MVDKGLCDYLIFIKIETDHSPFIVRSDNRFNPNLTSIVGNERTEVIYGSSNVLDREILFFSNAKLKVNTYMDYSRPALALRIKPIKRSFIEAKNRNAKLRYITDIKAENICYCKELMEIAEVRHLDGIKGNFMVSEKEYLAPLSSPPNSEISSQIIYSNLQEIVDQQNYIFDTLWNKAVSAISRIKEIEEGIEPTGTRLLEDPDEIFNHMEKVIANASKRLICSSTGGMQLVYNNFFDSYKRILDKSRGEGIRWITNIDRNNIDLVKIFLNAGIQIRHIKNLTPMNFGVDDKYFHSTIEKMEGGKMMRRLLTSNEPIYINHYNSIFEELWKDGNDASQRIRDIEEGADIADIEVFRSASRAREVYLDLVKEATEEILLLFPTINAFIRQEEIVQGSLLLSNAKKSRKKIKFRILMPFKQQIEPKITNFKRSFYEKVGSEIRYIESVMLNTQATILVTDRKKSMVMEIKDDSKMNFDEAIGLSTYSNSKAGVLSYVSIFENLWKQVELYEDIKISHDQLIINEKMQREFINVAAHELRTPIQPILGLTEILRSQITDSKQRELLGVTIRNAKRLNKLSSDILDITKLESNTFELNKEICNLKDIIVTAIDDIVLSNEFANKKKNLQLLYEPQDILLNVDKSRIAEVLANLLSNAVKFTSKGTIAINIEQQQQNDKNKNKNDDSDKNSKKMVIVNIQDTGQGIDTSIMPRLFTKFVSKSFQGTGLGLFISKGIIEAHHGSMWGKNNDNGIGAAFSFSLPAM